MSKKPKSEPVEGFCKAEACKAKDWKFSFCQEHFEQYKFGLITKDGVKASDFDRKIDHYQNYRRKQKPAKAA